jgi:hypothetical protein
MGLALDAALTSASSKAAGMFTPDLARRLGEQLLQLPPPL